MVTLSWIAIIVGGFVLLSVGCCVGLLFGALCNAASEADRQMGLK